MNNSPREIYSLRAQRRVSAIRQWQLLAPKAPSIRFRKHLGSTGENSVPPCYRSGHRFPLSKTAATEQPSGVLPLGPTARVYRTGGMREDDGGWWRC